MNFTKSTKLYFCLILWVLFCETNLAIALETPVLCDETCIVSTVPGEKPGQYCYRFGAGFNLVPRCFAIDPNNGTFYIPEVDTKDNIRLHKFDKTGKFINMLKLEGKANLISNAAVGLNGEIYLYCGVPHVGHYIIRYDENGKLLNSFGPQGTITEEDVAKVRIRSPENEPYRDKFFIGNFRSFSIVDGYLEVVHTNPHDVSFFYRFHGKTGQVPNRDAKIPGDIEEIITGREEKYKIIIKELIKQKRLCGIANPLIGSDGELYYMSVNPEKLEIRKVTFHE